MNDGKKPELKALAYLQSRSEAYGVAAVQVSDGELFMISRKKMEELLAEMCSNDQKNCLIFVQHGKSVDDLEASAS